MRAIVYWCGLAMLGCLAGIIDSFAEEEPHLPEALWVVPLVGVIPAVLIVVAVLVSRRGREASTPAAVFRSIPIPARWGAALLVLTGAVLAAIAATGLHTGTPEVTATGYQLYTRLGSTPITRAEYLQEIARSQRLFAAIGFGLNAMVGACAVGAARDR